MQRFSAAVHTLELVFVSSLGGDMEVITEIKGNRALKLLQTLFGFLFQFVSREGKICVFLLFVKWLAAKSIFEA